MQLLSQFIRNFRARGAPQARNPDVAQQTPEFGHSTAGLEDCAGEDSAAKAQELLDAWMEEDRRRVLTREQRQLP